MAWHQWGDKPLSEPMMAWVTDAYASLVNNELSAHAVAPAPSTVKHGIELILSDCFAHNVKLAIFIQKLSAGMLHNIDR